MKRFLLGLLAVWIFMGCSAKNHADYIVTNATIWTGNPQQPEAQAMAVQGDKIVAIGSKEEVEKWQGEKTEVVDAQGAFITPGFIDTHTHFLDGGFNLLSIKLRDAKTPEEFSRRIAEYAKTLPEGTWILGGDWDHENWGGTLPTKEWIDAATPNHPVFVTRLDGHMSLANSAALKLAGITEQVKEVPGGSIVRHANGQLTGILKDNAANLVYKAIPNPTPEQSEKALLEAMNYVASNGVTSVHHMVGGLDALNKAHAEGKLITRIYAMYALDNWPALQQHIQAKGRGDNWLKFGGLKGFVDGSLGSHTAAFFHPYTDLPSDSGFFINPTNDLYRWIKSADSAGLQVMVHAIGDKAIHTLLNLYEQIGRENGTKDRRFRIEHAQHIAPADIPRFGQLNVIPAMQPYHAIDDGRFADRLIGAERSKTTYAFKSLFDANAKVAFGSDWSVAPATPLEGIYAAVTRRTLDDKNPAGWVPNQKIIVQQALEAYTTNAAYSSFEEKVKGSLEVGKLADFVLLSADIRQIPPHTIRDVQVKATYVGGKKVYLRSAK